MTEIIDITPHIKKRDRLKIINEPKRFSIKSKTSDRTVNSDRLLSEVLFNVMGRRGQIEELFYFYDLLGRYLSHIVNEVPIAKHEVQLKELGKHFQRWATIFYRLEKQIQTFDDAILQEMVDDKNVSFRDMINRMVDLVLNSDDKK